VVHRRRERCKTAGLRVGRVALKGDGGALVVLPDADDSALRNLAAACKALPKWCACGFTAEG